MKAPSRAWPYGPCLTRRPRPNPHVQNCCMPLLLRMNPQFGGGLGGPLRSTRSIAWLTRVLCGIHVLRRRWTEPSNLNNSGFVTGLCEVIPRWWFGVETTRWQSLQFRRVKPVTIADTPCARDYSRNPVVTMRVRSNARLCRDAKHDGIYARLVRIALQNNGLDSSNA